MSAREIFEFAGYTLRPAGAIATDHILARQWTAADPWHKDTVDPALWTSQGDGIDAYVLFDKEGPVFFWVGILNPSFETLEMHMQFAPKPENREEALRQGKRVKAGLVIGLNWLEAMLRKSGVKEIYFDSDSEMLARFAKKTLNFIQTGRRLRKRLLSGDIRPCPNCQGNPQQGALAAREAEV